MAWGRITDRTRKTFRVGPRKAYYYRNYAIKVSRDGAKGGFKSHGFKVGSRTWRLLGSLTVNLTNKTWTWDRPGPGATHGSWGKPKTMAQAVSRWIPVEEHRVERQVSRQPRERIADVNELDRQ